MTNKISSLLMGIATVTFMGAGFAGVLYVLEQEDTRLPSGSMQAPATVQQSNKSFDLEKVSARPESPQKSQMAGKPSAKPSYQIETVVTRQVDVGKQKPAIVAAISASGSKDVMDAPMRQREISLAKAKSAQVSLGTSITREKKRDFVAARKSGSSPIIKVDGPPLEDSAEIALINASLTLPESLNIFRASSGTYGSDVNSSLLHKAALKPRLFKTGRAFGGFTEAEFKKRELRCMATGIYFEARGEPIRGQQAVAQTIMNRVRSPDYPDTICGVIFQGDHRRTGCQFSFACDGKTDRPANARQWDVAKKVARQITTGKIWMKDIGFSTHYHATYVNPYWKKDMRFVKRIGRHIFYKAKNVSVTDTFQRVRGSSRS